jgi:4-hydroxybenzoate polyprenyltransferase
VGSEERKAADSKRLMFNMTSAPSQPAIGRPQSAMGNLALFARDIKISHTVFALPWAVLAAFLAARETHHPLTAGKVLLILLCMVTARTVAMAANRLLDAKLDAMNPRTARRAIPSGGLSRGFVGAIVVACVAGFAAACYGFYYFYDNPYPVVFSLPVLGFLAAYPLLKRFTRLCHYYLGAALALAPICAWVAVSGQMNWPPLIMAGAVLLWTAGFDIIYACQDYDSDRATGVHSVPSTLGIAPALWVARLTHTGCAALLITLGLFSPTLSLFYFVGVAIAIALLIVEHSLVKANDLSRVGLAFFTVNGIISLLVGTLGLIDILRAH